MRLHHAQTMVEVCTSMSHSASSWGNILAQAPQYYLTVPSLMVWPGLAILLATLAFNLLGDGLRDAFDPRKMG